jgi:hypothetical protein
VTDPLNYGEAEHGEHSHGDHSHGEPSDSLPVTSSVPEEIPEEQADLFRLVLTSLEQRGFPFAVSGAFALRAHTGICRFTKDLDLFMTARTACRAFPYLLECGLECDICDRVWLAKARRGEFFVDLITGMSNAVIVVEDSWIERAIPAVVYGVTTRVLAAEELIASKLFVAKRERFDGADIAHIFYAAPASFDWERLLQLVGEHWELLLWSMMLFRYAYPGQSDRIPRPVWRDLLRRFEEQLGKDNHNAEFRGSLVDENMFAIDTNEWGLANLLQQTRQQRLAEIDAMAECEPDPESAAVRRAS